MKLLTLNVHSLVEKNYRQKLTDFVETVAQLKPDIIALQESSQSADASAVGRTDLDSYTPCSETAVIRADNHVFSAVKMLADMGVDYHWTWLPVKKSYGKYDEGLALMSLSPILEVDTLTVSKIDDYLNWKTRKIIGIRTENAPDEWFFSVHYGWWADADEPFKPQWQKTTAHMAQYGKVWLMGDFNNPAELRGEGYDLIANGGWIDSYTLAEQRDSGITVARIIDGWERMADGVSGMRIDQIWCSRPVRVRSSRVIFNRTHHPIVSDHYGVIIEYERSPQ